MDIQKNKRDRMHTYLDNHVIELSIRNEVYHSSNVIKIEYRKMK